MQSMESYDFYGYNNIQSMDYIQSIELYYILLYNIFIYYNKKVMQNGLPQGSVLSLFFLIFIQQTLPIPNLGILSMWMTWV
jgi:hypothetical protein